MPQRLYTPLVESNVSWAMPLTQLYAAVHATTGTPYRRQDQRLCGVQNVAGSGFVYGMPSAAEGGAQVSRLG